MARRAFAAVARMVSGLCLCTLMVWLPLLFSKPKLKYSVQTLTKHDYDNNNGDTAPEPVLNEFNYKNNRQQLERANASTNHTFNNESRNNNSNNSNSSIRPKNKLYIHVGPPKTATTTLQTQLTLIRDELSMDNYEYIGRWYHPVIADDRDIATASTTANKLVSNHRTDTRAVWMFRYVWDDRKPEITMEALREELQKEYGQAGVNLVVSEETLGANFRKKQYYKQMAETLGQDWDIVIVGTYRRLIDWIPSSKFQQERMQHSWPGQGGRALGPLFPEVLEMKSFYRNYKYLDTIIDLVDDSFPFRILNLHDDQQDLLTQFTCTVLENSTHACQKARQKRAAAAASTTTMFNARAEDASGNILYYDAIGIEAVNRLWIPNATHVRRDKVYRKIQAYQEQFKKKTAFDMAQICPSETQLYTLLNRSLQIEDYIFSTGQVARLTDNANPVDVDDKNRRTQQHIQVFQEMINKKTFCWIDLEKELMDPEWKRFFQIHEQDFLVMSRTRKSADDEGDDEGGVDDDEDNDDDPSAVS